MKWIKAFLLLLIILVGLLLVDPLVQISLFILVGFSLPFWWKANVLPLVPTVLTLALITTIVISVFYAGSSNLDLLSRNTTISETLILSIAGLINMLTIAICLLMPAFLIRLWAKPAKV
ncbi:hypothetical protein AB9P05_16280 [Roseivirga sp. BDSF3-8]|uniref:hypothetical protein n=1 Tax=Roseivirga sp. BDSF3-8 TaxID=3241598 RepID=UPI0035321F16